MICSSIVWLAMMWWMTTRNPNHATSTMEEAIAKIIDLQSEINRDIDRLVDLKQEITATIKTVDNNEYQTILEKRYLCFLSWEKIAVDMGYSIRNVQIGGR